MREGGYQGNATGDTSVLKNSLEKLSLPVIDVIHYSRCFNLIIHYYEYMFYPIYQIIFEGTLDDDENRNYNVLYWFDKHLRVNFNLSLHQFAESGLNEIMDDHTRMWKWSKTAMSIKFRF